MSAIDINRHYIQTYNHDLLVFVVPTFHLQQIAIHKFIYAGLITKPIEKKKKLA